MNARGITPVGMMVVMVISLVVLGITNGIAINKIRTDAVERFRMDINGRANNLYKLIRRDILLAGSMASSWDSLVAIEVNGDTLIIRFSELDKIQYYLDRVNQLHREDVIVAQHIQSFAVTEDDFEIQVTLDVGANRIHRFINNGNLYHRVYEWTIIPQTIDYRNRNN